MSSNEIINNSSSLIPLQQACTLYRGPLYLFNTHQGGLDTRSEALYTLQDPSEASITLPTLGDPPEPLEIPTTGPGSLEGVEGFRGVGEVRQGLSGSTGPYKGR